VTTDLNDPADDSPVPPVFRPYHRMMFRHHPTLAHLFVPNVNVRVPGAGGGHFVRTNAQGFRSDFDFVAAHGDRPRVLFFGDSVTAGDGCENSERFSDLVGELLDVETYNYGLPGSGTDQQLLVLRDCAREVEADAIVLGLYVENIERNKVEFRWALDRRNGRAFRMLKPYFDLQDGRLQLRNVPLPTRWPVDRIAPGGDHRALQIAAGDRKGFRRRVQLAAHRITDRSSRLRRIVSRLVRSPLHSWLKRTIGREELVDYRSRQSRGWRLLEAIVREFVAECGGKPVVLVPIPTYSHLVDEVPGQYQQRFEELAASLAGLHVLDLTTPLLRLSRRDRLALLQPDLTHFTAAGHRQVAELIAGELRQLGVIEARPPRPKPARPSSKHVWILGISCFFHDAGAAVIRDGEIVAAALEERFTRVKHDSRYPSRAINYCLEEAGIHAPQLSAIGYHQNLGVNLERMLTTVLDAGDAAGALTPRTLSDWFEQKLRLSAKIRDELHYEGPIYQGGHHRSHAAAAFFPSPFERAAVLTIDGVGDWLSAALGAGRGSTLEMKRECRFPQSVGLFYSAITRFLGFRANTDEYKVMGLAPYGTPRFIDRMRERLIRIHDDGSVELHEVFAIPSYERIAATVAEALGIPPRASSEPLRSEHADVARSLQELLEEVVLRMAAFARRETGERNLCLAGGVALNCAATGRLLRAGIFDDVWIQPAADDSGSALGLALDLYYTRFSGERRMDDSRTQQRDSCLGPAYSDDEIRAFLDTYGRPYEMLSPGAMNARVAELLQEGKIVGRFDGRGEFGPRALGSRSILADPRDSRMQAEVNRRIKQREGFRPFAPAIVEESAASYFELEGPSPYMSFAVPLVPSRRRDVPPVADGGDLRLLAPPPASDIPAVTHIDHSARVQTVSAERSPSFHAVVAAFGEKTGCPVVLNTSFNVNDEPIVWTPYDAYRCFMRSALDALSMGNALLMKEQQPRWIDDDGRAAPPGPPAFARRLHALVVRELARVSARGARDEHAAAAGWTLAAQQPPLTPLPEWPSERAGRRDAEAFVDALTAEWTSRRLRDALRPMVVRLVRLASRHAARPAAPSGVSDDLYVMF
jgi:carbamoyltransferase